MTVRSAFAALDRHAKRMRLASLRELFAADPKRFDRFHVEGAGLHLDYSKNLVVEETMELLLRLAEEADVKGHAKRMFAGEAINGTERRAVLHTALRAAGASGAKVDGAAVDPQIQAELQRFLGFAEEVRAGKLAAADGKPFTDVVNIGIGGSDLGP